jgi:hypothetical protein
VEMGLLAGDLTRFRKTEERQFPQHQHISTWWWPHRPKNVA